MFFRSGVFARATPMSHLGERNHGNSDIFSANLRSDVYQNLPGILALPFCCDQHA